MNAPDSLTPSDKLIGTNVPEFHEALRAAVDALERQGGGTITICRDKINRRAFMFADAKGVWLGSAAGDSDTGKREKIVTLKTGAAWGDCVAKLTATASAATQALGYYWAAVGCYFNAKGELGLARCKHTFGDLGPPKGSRLIVRATPHPAGFSR